MKSIKYTLAALAVIAMASVSTAKAGTAGDVILGVFNTTNSLQFDLGSYGSLTNDETWNLGNVDSTLSDSSGDLQFSLAAAATNLAAAGGLAKQTIAIGGVNVATTSNTLPFSAINTTESNAGTGTTITPAGTGYTETEQPSGQSPSYAFEDGGTAFGQGYDIDQSFTGNDTANFYTITKGGSAPTLVGEFTTTTVAGDTVLEFTTTATPEPSAYALGLTALALFWVLKRRSSTIA